MLKMKLQEKKKHLLKKNQMKKRKKKKRHYSAWFRGPFERILVRLS
jgi:hypothetical protein